MFDIHPCAGQKAQTSPIKVAVTRSKPIDTISYERGIGLRVSSQTEAIGRGCTHRMDDVLSLGMIANMHVIDIGRPAPGLLLIIC